MHVTCQGSHDSDECQRLRQRENEFFQYNPGNERCRKLRAMKACHETPESKECRKIKERFKAYCEEHPGSKNCVRAKIHRICKNDPKSQACLGAKEQAHQHLCNNHPNHKKCT